MELRARILRGDLGAGMPLRQEDLASSLGVSRVPVREALRMLESEGHVLYAPHRGYRVADWGIEDLAETYRLRALIEDDLARRSVTSMTPEDLAHVEVAHASLAECEGAAATVSSGRASHALARANRAFHWSILRPGPRADRILTTLWDTSDAYRARWFADPTNVSRGARDHHAILTAVRAADVETVVTLLDAHRESAVQALTATLP